jgi:hypothetical protein
MLALVKFRAGFPELVFLINRRFSDIGLVAIRTGKDFARPLEYETAIAANVNHIIPLSENNGTGTQILLQGKFVR